MARTHPCIAKWRQMIREFKYELPDEAAFLKALILTLKQKDPKLASLLKLTRLTLHKTTIYAPYAGGTIFNAYATIASFAVPPSYYEEVSKYLTFDRKKVIMLLCEDILVRN